jgi:outer membrane protein TolC|tara:strand:+ start:33255 stop:34841 length:1587 start_codon:yes stop_codon:yes gene_type:complete
MRKHSLKIMLLTATALTLSGCFVSPEVIQKAEHQKRATMDMNALYMTTPALMRPLTMSEAISRGLLYNYDYKMGLMEEVLQNNQLTLANFNMLPRLAANAGYGWRSDERASRSISLNTREESLEPSFSEERSVRNADLSFSWNLLDFGLSYFTAKQQSDRVLAAVERRRRVMNNMVKEIQSAYWKAQSAQELLPQVEDLIILTDKALVNSKKIELSKLQAPLQSLEYRRSLLQVMSQIKQLRHELSIAKSQLRSLINLPPTQDFVLARPNTTRTLLPAVPSSLQSLQKYSLVYRAELREEAYQERIDEQNITKEIIRIFPGLSLLSSTNYDSNKYLAFSNWQELGVRATWNLINVLQAPKAIQSAKTQVEISQMRRLALTAAVLSQVSISYSQYLQAVEGYKTADELSVIEAKVLKISQDATTAKSGTELDAIQRSAQSLSAKLERNNALANAQVAYANLAVSIGADLVPSGHESKSLDDMTATVHKALDQVMNDGLTALISTQSVQEATTEAYEAPTREDILGDKKP